MTIAKMMKIIEYYENTYSDAKTKVFPYGIVDVDSWRGAYAEPAFAIGKNVKLSTMKQVIEEALSDVFTGYKGGDFTYDASSPVNFEMSGSHWSDGKYTSTHISKYDDEDIEEVYQTYDISDEEEKLFYLMLFYQPSEESKEDILSDITQVINLTSVTDSYKLRVIEYLIKDYNLKNN